MSADGKHMCVSVRHARGKNTTGGFQWEEVKKGLQPLVKIPLESGQSLLGRTPLNPLSASASQHEFTSRRASSCANYECVAEQSCVDIPTTLTVVTSTVRNMEAQCKMRKTGTIHAQQDSGAKLRFKFTIL